MKSIEPDIQDINPKAPIEIICPANSVHGISGDYTVRLGLTSIDKVPIDGIAKLVIANQGLYTFENHSPQQQISFKMEASPFNLDIVFKIRNKDLMANPPFPLMLQVVTYENGDSDTNGFWDHQQFKIVMNYSSKPSIALKNYIKRLS